MKKDIHPNYFETTITCGCGHVMKTRSTRENLKVEICNQCHPFYSGKQKLVDTAGRVERFRRKYGLPHDDDGEKKETQSKTTGEEVTSEN